MNPLISTLDALSAFLLSITTTDGDLDGAKVDVYCNAVTPTPNSVAGDFTAPTYTGHGAKTVTWLAPSMSDAGTPEVIGTLAEFRPTDGVTPNTVYGITLKTSGGSLRAASRISVPGIPLQSSMDSILCTIRLRLDPLTGFVVSLV